MIEGYDKTEYRWGSGKCRDKCHVYDTNNNRIKTMQDWQAEGLPTIVTNIKYHKCCSECCYRLK
jgi:hypothetical protein